MYSRKKFEFIDIFSLNQLDNNDILGKKQGAMVICCRMKDPLN